MAWQEDPSAINCVHCGARYGVKDLPFKISTALLSPELAARWTPLELDDRGEAFLRDCFEMPTWRMWLLGVACSWMRRHGWSLTDANGMLGRGTLFVLSRMQAEHLLGRPGGVLIDVGAGAGHVTKELAPLFDAVVATEASKPMVRQLARSGFAVHSGPSLDSLVDEARSQGVELGAGASVVSVLNVLDRCDSPTALLRDAISLLRPGGVLLLAVVLPFRPHVEEGRSNRPPAEKLGLDRQAGFEQSAVALWKALLEPLGLTLECFARVPYLSQGDQLCRVYTLEDSIWVLRKPDHLAKKKE